MNKLAIFYCGGCNSAYDRKEIATAIIQQVKDQYQIVQPEALQAEDQALLLCGCQTVCLGEREDLTFLGQRWLIGPDSINYQPIPPIELITQLMTLLKS